VILLLPLRPFLKRYLPVFLGGIFSSIFAGSSVVVVVQNYYLKAISLAISAQVAWWACVVLACALSLSNIMIVRGRRDWVWVMVVYFGACLVTALPAIRYSPHLFIYAESLFWPLLGLLILNSKRHREMRGKLVELRFRRKRIQKIADRLQKR
jgi:hypothetical protein